MPNTAATTLNAAYVNSINDAGPVTIFGFIDLTNGASCNITGLGFAPGLSKGTLEFANLLNNEYLNLSSLDLAGLHKQQTKQCAIKPNQPLFKHSAATETNDWSATVPVALSAERESAFSSPAVELSGEVTPPSATFASETLALQSAVSTFFGDAYAFVGEMFAKLGAAILPTASAENNKNSSGNNPSAAPFAGETVTINGSGSGFTLPAGKSVTITFEVTLNNPPNLTGVPPAAPQVSTQGSVAGSNFTTVLTDEVAGAPVTATVTPVDLYDTTTALVSDNNPSDQGEQVIFTATVAAVANPNIPGGTNPTGTVDFIDTSNGNAVICDNVPLSSGVATCQTNTLTAATHNIRADYSGDGNFDPSQSNIVAQVVNACTTNPIVSNTNDGGAGSLRQAIANVCASPNNNITFSNALVYPTFIQLTSGELNVAKSVNITGPGANQLEVRGNQTVTGFRVFNVASGITANISGLTITGGGNVTNGAGVNNLGTLNLSACAVKANQSLGAGGGISNSGTLTITACTVSNNVALALGGGGIFNHATGALTITNSTISTNTANVGGNGGGILSAATTAPIIKSSTIAANFADGAGGGISNTGAPIDITNTIVGDNDTTSDNAKDLNGAFNSQDFNLFETSDTAVITGTTTNNKTGDGKLGALTDNGGATFTHTLLIDSQALDAGGDANAAGLTNDQRGAAFNRFRDAADAGTTQTVDIGAVEVDPTVENITDKTTNEDTQLSFSFNVGDDTTAFDSITAVSDNTTLVPNLAANIAVSGAANSGQRTLTINPAADQSGTANITVTVTKTIGGATLSMADDFLLTVTAVNDAPTAVNDPLTPVAEDSGTRTISIASLTANDSPGANEGTQTLTLALVAGSATGGTVTQDATNVYFTPTADYNGAASFQYTVTDNGTPPLQSNAATVSFTIWEVNDAPTAVNDTLLAVGEDSGTRIIPFADLTGNDSKGPANESGQTLIVKTVSNPVGGTVIINGGNVEFTPTTNFTGTASFDYTVEDNGTTNGVNDFKTSAAATVSFNITAVNDAPTLDAIADPAAILEDAGLQTVNLSGISAGGGETQTLTVTATSGNPSLIPNPTVNYTSPNATGSLSYTPVANAFGSAVITVTVTDNGGTANGGVNTTSRTFTVNVTPVNDAPSFTKGADQTVNEDAGAQTVNNWATNISAGPNEAGQVLTFNLTNNNNTLFSAQPAIDSAGTLTYTPGANASGSATVTVVLKDDGGTANGGQDTSAQQTFVITVNAINDAPTLDAIPNPAAIAEDSGAQTVNLSGISAGAANENGQTLTVTASSDNTALIPNPTVNYTSPNATGSLSYTPVANANGTAIITVTVTDNGGTANGGVNTFQRTFTVTVWEVNDAPTAVNDTLSDVAEDSGQRVIPFSALTANDSKGPANESGQTLIVKTVGNPTGGTVGISGTDVLFTPTADYNGAASFTYTVEDNGTTNGVNDFKTSAAATVSFNITAVNDAPTLDAIADPAAILEDAGLQTVNLSGISAGGGETQTLTVTASSNNTALIPNPTVNYTSPNATGSLSYTPVANAFGSAVITVTVTDNGGTANGGVNETTRTFTVNVTAVNDAPSFTKGADQAVPRNAGAQTVPNWATNISAGPNESGQTLTFNLTNNNNALFSAQPAIDSMGTLTYTPAANTEGAATVSVTLTDNGGTANGGQNTSATQTFTIIVTDTITWRGAAGAGGTDWHTASNWEPAAVPIPTSKVFIPATGVLNEPTVSAANVTVSTLSVSGGRTLTINGNRSLAVTNGCAVDGTVNVLGSFACGDLNSTTGTVIYAGTTGEQTITAGSYFNLAINNQAGGVLGGSNTTTTTVKGVLTLTNGIVKVEGERKLTVTEDATISGGSASSYVIGSLQKLFGPPPGFDTLTRFTYPVGTANGYSPVRLSNMLYGQDGASLTISANQGTYPFAASGLPANRLARWWRFSNGSGATKPDLTRADVRFSYLAADITAGLESRYRAFRIQNGTAFNQTTTIDAINHRASVGNVTDFNADWTLAESAR